MSDITKLIRTIPNYPKEGIMFRDITTLLKDPKGFKMTINMLVEKYKDQIDSHVPQYYDLCIWALLPRV